MVYRAAFASATDVIGQSFGDKQTGEARGTPAMMRIRVPMRIKTDATLVLEEEEVLVIPCAFLVINCTP